MSINLIKYIAVVLHRFILAISNLEKNQTLAIDNSGHRLNAVKVLLIYIYIYQEIPIIFLQNFQSFRKETRGSGDQPRLRKRSPRPRTKTDSSSSGEDVLRGYAPRPRRPARREDFTEGYYEKRSDFLKTLRIIIKINYLTHIVECRH